MKKLMLVLAAIAATVLASRAEDAPAPVKAVRYRVRVVESALEATHGGGTWIEELYFPAKGVVANVENDYNHENGVAVVHAFYGAMRNKSRELLGGPAMEVPTEDVEVPAALAERIFALAELTRRLGDEQRALAEAALAAGTLHTGVEAPPLKARGFEFPPELRPR
jgi:hypothetical protein